MKEKILILRENIQKWDDLETILCGQYECDVMSDVDITKQFLFMHRYIKAIILCIDKENDFYEDFLLFVKNNPVLSLIPVIVLIDTYDDYFVSYLLKNGATSCISIKISPETILCQIERLIKFCHMSNLSNSFHNEKKTMENLKVIMDSVTCGITASEEDNYVDNMLFTNKRFDEITGINNGSYQRFLSHIDPDDRKVIIERVSPLRVGEETVVEYNYIKPNNIWRYLRQYITKIRLTDVNGNVIISVVDDITDQKIAEKKAQKELEEKNTRNRLLDDASCIVTVVDAKTRQILFINKTGIDYFQNEVENSRGNKCYSFLKGLDSPCKDCCMKYAGTDNFYEFNYSVPGKNKHFNINIKKITWAGREAYVSYYSDESTIIEQRKQLLASSRALQTASKNTGVFFWEYDIDEKKIDFKAFGERSYSGYQDHMEDVINHMIDCKYVHEDDVKDFIRLYDDLDKDKETSEGFFRLMDLNTREYNCFHIVYTRIYDSIYKNRIAVGFIENIDQQIEMRNRYTKELQLRNEMIKDAAIYYEVDLADSYLLEYYSKYKDISSMVNNSHLTEKTRQEILEHTFEDDREYVRNNLFTDVLLKAFNNGETSKDLRYRRYIKNNQLHWVHTTVNMIKNPDTKRITAFICIHDINEEELEKTALKTTIDKDIESLAIINVKNGMTRLVRNNMELCDMSIDKYYPHDEYITEIINQKMNKKDANRYLNAMKIANIQSALQNNAELLFSFSIKGPDGKLKRKRSQAYYIDGNKGDIVLVRRDVTEIYEEEQRKKAALKAAVNVANDANRAKSDFLSRMSHDMRTPMNAIIGMTYLAREEESLDRIREYLDSIDSSSQFLLGLINDVLDLSKIESEAVELKKEPYALADFIRSIESIIRPLMNAKNINFEITMGCGANNLIVDKLRFNQIFFNMLTNAAKYTRENGTVKFYAEHIPDKNNMHGVRFYIEDNGIGMSDSFIKKLYTPFAQEHSKELPEQLGTGLGLAIVKKLVDLMGGYINVESEVGKGTKFIVDLYAEESEEGNIKSKEIIDYSILKGMRILAVDDQTINLRILRSILEKKDCIVETTTNGPDAINMFNSSEPGYYSVIIMDIRMPEMSGIEATKIIRLLDKADAKTIPIVAMTADAFNAKGDETQRAGMNMYLTKPIVPDELFEYLVQIAKAYNVSDTKNNT